MKIIAIDGPSGSGKGTIAKEIAKKLNYTYIDTGAMYRCVALKSIRDNVGEDEEEKLINILKNIDIKLTNDGKCFLDNEDVSEEIRTMEVTSKVARISPIPKLREIMREKQNDYANKDNIVMEGRDITTDVFPNADYKFYLDASVTERANRRFKQNTEKGINTSYEDIKKSIEERDYIDKTRKVGALRRTDDQIYIDSSNMTIEEVINKIMEEVK